MMPFSEFNNQCKACICPGCDLFQSDECLDGKDCCDKCDNGAATCDCPFYTGEDGGESDG